jgi:hypothetical protein
MVVTFARSLSGSCFRISSSMKQKWSGRFLDDQELAADPV